MQYLIGVDGGGTGTRVRLADAQGTELAQGRAGPSGLALGISSAWASVNEAVDDAFAHAGLARPARSHLALGLGLAGVNVKVWAEKFTAANPGYGALVLETDAYTTLMGAHGGQPGCVVALGTGSVGLALWPDGQRREVGGWGFQTGDEASGAWLGMRAINHLEQVLDGRQLGGALAQALMQTCGSNRDELFGWVNRANQTRFAQLAPQVLLNANHDKTALQFLMEAGEQVERMVQALDPGQHLPLALSGGLSGGLRPYLPPDLRARALAPAFDSSWGALQLIQTALMT
jgi:glucosamine kinase